MPLLRSIRVALFLGVAGCATSEQPEPEPKLHYTLVPHDVRLLLAFSSEHGDGAVRDLESAVKEAMGVGHWDGDTGASITWADDGFLLVKANPMWQRKVAAVLQDMGRIGGSMRRNGLTK